MLVSFWSKFLLQKFSENYLCFTKKDCWQCSNKRNIQKIFEEELFVGTLSTTLLQIFCKFTLHSKVIFKSMKGPEDTVLVNIKAKMSSS